MEQLKISTAGVRGIVGQGLNAEITLGFAQAFATYLEGGTIAVGDDSRPSATLVRSGVIAGLLACGSRVIDLGSVPSPTLRIYMPKIEATGAVIVGAGHNPVDWNALKFLRRNGMYLNSLQGQELLEIYNHSEFRKADWQSIQALESDRESIDYHLDRLAESFDLDVIRPRHFKVAVDCCNGTCSLITPLLLERAGCKVVAMNTNIHRPFPRKPNPTPDNMTQLEALVKGAGADVGFGHDAEGERLGIVDGEGRALSQELTLAICLLILLKTGSRSGPVVTNLSTSMIVDDIAGRFGVQVHRTPIGQSYVAEKAVQVGAALAGEGSGQVILPWLHSAPDGMAVILYILEYMARTGETLSALVDQLPKYFMVKENLTLPSGVLYRKLQDFRKEARRPGGEFSVDMTDGVKLLAADRWVQVRASSTESMLRIIAEARTRAVAEKLHHWAHDLLVE